MSTKRLKMERSSDNHDDERKPAGIRDAIKIKNSNIVASIDTPNMELFESEQDVQQEKPPLNPRTKWYPSFTWGTKTQPVIVQVLVNRITASPWAKSSSSHALEAAIHKHFSTERKPFQDDEPYLYKIGGNDDVMGQRQSWMKQLPSRFDDSRKRGILYRPKIVKEIFAKVEENLSMFVAQGLFVSGHEGIGKSHSIVNVVRKLQSTGNYLVTFMPDCGNFKTSDDLIEAICSSFGSSYENLDLHYFKARNAYNDEEDFPDFINAVDNVLKSKDKQWVFVFDQINRLFARFKDKKEIGVLDFPFYFIQQVMFPGRITSIISASANTEILCKDRHRGFEEYVHRRDMTDEEIQLAFSEVIVNEMQWTGNVPLYIDMLRFKEKPKEKFTATIHNSVELCFTNLLNQTQRNDWLQSMFINNICQILLGQTFHMPLGCYDKRLFVQVCNETRDEWSYQPLSPLVEEAVREFFWADLMLHVVNKFHEPSDTNFRVFQGLVVQRCLQRERK